MIWEEKNKQFEDIRMEEVKAEKRQVPLGNDIP